MGKLVKNSLKRNKLLSKNRCEKVPPPSLSSAFDIPLFEDKEETSRREGDNRNYRLLKTEIVRKEEGKTDYR